MEDAPRLVVTQHGQRLLGRFELNALPDGGLLLREAREIGAHVGARDVAEQVGVVALRFGQAAQLPAAGTRSASAAGKGADASDSM